MTMLRKASNKVESAARVFDRSGGLQRRSVDGFVMVRLQLPELFE